MVHGSTNSGWHHTSVSSKTNGTIRKTGCPSKVTICFTTYLAFVNLNSLQLREDSCWVSILLVLNAYNCVVCRCVGTYCESRLSSCNLRIERALESSSCYGSHLLFCFCLSTSSIDRCPQDYTRVKSLYAPYICAAQHETARIFYSCLRYGASVT